MSADITTPPLKKWISLLQGIGNELENLTAFTESEFLTIGARLQDLSTQAKNISECASTIVGYFGGDEVQDVILSLKSLSEKTRNYVKLNDESSKTGRKTLEQLNDEINTIVNATDGIDKIVRFLGILGITTKIECSRLNQNNVNFNSLAKDVGQLAISMRSQLAPIVEALESIKKIIIQKRFLTNHLRSDHDFSISASLKQTTSSINLLIERHKQSSKSMKNISISSGEITQNINNVVIALQFHDITRQKIEHVKSSIDDLIDKLSHSEETSTDPNNPDHFNTLDTISLINNISSLEAAQLDNTLNEFTNSVDQLNHSLSNITVHITNMGEEIHNLVGMTDDNNSSFISEIEVGVDGVTSSLMQSVQNNKEMSSTLAPLTYMIENINSFVDDVEKISAKINLIALNALVQAAKIEGQGAPLGVLAESIREQSVTARTQTTSFLEVSQNVTTAGDILKTVIVTQTNDIETRIHKLVSDFKSVLYTLQHDNEKIVQSLTIMQESGQNLTQDIEQTVENISINILYHNVLSNAISGFNHLASASQKFVPDKVDGQMLQDIKKLQDRYTMKSERDIHHSVTNLQSNESEFVTKDNNRFLNEENVSYDADNLGDNVELF